MSKRKRQYDDDDGRVIANMDVDGMPWTRPGLFRGRKQEKKPEDDRPPLELTREEKWALYSGAMKAGLLICLIFIGFFALFILFCQYVVFR